MTGSTLEAVDQGRIEAAGQEGSLDPARVEAFAGRLFELYTGGAADLPRRHRPPDRPVRGGRGRPRDQRRAGRPGRPPGAVRPGVAGCHGDRRHPRPRPGRRHLPAPGRARRLPHRAGLGQPGPDEPARHPPGQARRRGRPGLPGGRRPLRRVPARVHRRHGRPGTRRLRRAARRRVRAAGPRLAERLAAGARVADVGCGTGHAIVLLAAAYPSSTFVGYDLADDAIARARSEAAAAGLANARFEVRDAARLTVEEPFDVVFVFDAVHDQVAPAAVLERIHAALAPGGTFVMAEPRASSDLAGNLGNPVAPLLYAVSTLHCLTVSLAGDGAGLGTAWGEELARSMLADAGFVDVTVHEAPGDPLNTVFVATRPAA